MARRYIGTITIPPGAVVDLHEKRTADFLATVLEKDIEFLIPNRQRGLKTPDIIMDGLDWEIKVPVGRSSRTIENNLRRAQTQSPNIILDLRRIDGRVPTDKLVRKIENQFFRVTSLKHIIVITRQDEHVDFNR